MRTATASGSSAPANTGPARARAFGSGGAGDQLLEVYRGNAAKVQAYFDSYVSHETAEDLTAATFERVVRWWSRYDPEAASPWTWIRAIARNVLVDHFRRQSHRTSVSLDQHPSLAASLMAAGDPGDRVLSLDVMRDWFRWLEPRERAVLALRIAGDWSAADIARHLALSEANVHQISSRALRRLQLQVPSAPMPADVPGRQPPSVASGGCGGPDAVSGSDAEPAPLAGRSAVRPSLPRRSSRRVVA